MLKPDWKANEGMPVGKGATFQQWVATLGNDQLVMDVAPWGEGHLKVNGREIGQVKEAKDRRGAFRELNRIAERYLEGQVIEPAGKKPSSMIPSPLSSCSSVITRGIMARMTLPKVPHERRRRPLPSQN